MPVIFWQKLALISHLQNMLTIICGENTIEAYNFFLEKKKEFIDKKYEVLEIDSSAIDELIRWQSENLSLFATKKVFFTRNLNKKINKKNQKTLKVINQIANDKNINLFDFEETVEKRNLKVQKNVLIKEFKLSTSIFNFLDNFYPGNLKTVIKNLSFLSKTTAIELIFFMLTKRIRQLLMVKFNQKIDGLQLWQLRKLNYQDKLWPKQSLIKFYQSLFQLEIKVKTSTNPFDLKKSLELLFSYLL
jgi:hypothetical protein